MSIDVDAKIINERKAGARVRHIRDPIVVASDGPSTDDNVRLVLVSYSKGGCDGKRELTVIHIKFSDIPCVARAFHDAIKVQQKSVNHVKSRMRGEE